MAKLMLNPLNSPTRGAADGGDGGIQKTKLSCCRSLTPHQNVPPPSRRQMLHKSKEIVPPLCAIH